MAQTTSAVNAKDVNVQLGDVAESLVDVSGSSNECSIEFSRELGEYGTFESVWMKRLENRQSVSLSFTAVYSTAEEEAVDLLKEWAYLESGARTLQIQIPDSSAGSDQFSGKFRLADLNFPLDSGEAGPIIAEATLESDGVIAMTTIAS